MSAVLFPRITDHGDYSHADEARLDIASRVRADERRAELDHLERHILACIRGERKDTGADGVTRALDMAGEVTSLVTEHNGLDELVKRTAAYRKDRSEAARLAMLDQWADIFDDCVRSIATDRLPVELQEEDE